jgi:hypothetical protein
MPNIHLVRTGPVSASSSARKISADVQNAGNVTNATASASVTGGMHPEGSANASGPTSADAGTTSSNQGGLMGAMKDLGSHGNGENRRIASCRGESNMFTDNSNFGGQGHQQGEYAPRNRNY